MDLEELLKLWDEMSQFGSKDSDEALNHYMKRLCEWLNADNAFWVGSVRVVKGARARADAMSGWRVRAVHILHVSEAALERKRQTLKAMHTKDPGAPNIAIVAGAGHFRAYTLQGGKMFDLESFKKTEHYDYFYRQRGISDRMWLAVPVNADTESIFCFDRYTNEKPFSESELELASFAVRGVKWFHRQLLLNHGLGICVEPLTEAELRVKQQLLSGASEKEIAKLLELTPGTVHHYATRIYRKFGIKGRTEFMSLWLNGSID